MVHLAYDRSLDDGIDRKVALKFMRHKEQFLRELEVRQGAKFSDEYVINVIRTIDGEEEFEKYGAEFINKGFDDYLYLIIMTAGDRSLAAVIASEHIAGTPSLPPSSTALISLLSTPPLIYIPLITTTPINTPFASHRRKGL